MIRQDRSYKYTCTFFLKIIQRGNDYISTQMKVHVAHMGPTWALSAQVDLMLAPWTLLSG